MKNNMTAALKMIEKAEKLIPREEIVEEEIYDDFSYENQWETDEALLWGI